jgi:flagellar basal body rod protein FlgG
MFSWLLFISCNNNELLNEYKLLYTDLENLYTYGYKSYYSHELNKAIPIINIGQGSIQQTGIPSDFAIVGDGFLKIDNKIGYTRNGQFKINEYGELKTKDEFSLFEPIFLPEYFLPDTLKINSDGYIFVSIPKNNGELVELEVGKIIIYKVPIELLEYYESGIYIIKGTTDNETIIDTSTTFLK